MQYPQIVEARAVDDYTLIVHFSNQVVRQYDIRQLFTKQMFAPLQRPAFFKNFKIEAGGYALVWNEEIDISEYELWENGTAVTDEGRGARQEIESCVRNVDAVDRGKASRLGDFLP